MLPFILANEASDRLINLSPAEMKALLHFTLSGKEFLVEDGRWQIIVVLFIPVFAGLGDWRTDHTQ